MNPDYWFEEAILGDDDLPDESEPQELRDEAAAHKKQWDTIGRKSDEPTTAAPTEQVNKPFFHGTSARRLDSILKEGLKKQHAGEIWGRYSRKGTVYFTSTFDSAKRWAKFAAERQPQLERADAVILEIHVPPEVRAQIEGDKNFQGRGRYNPNLFEFHGDVPPAWIKRACMATLQSGTGDWQCQDLNLSVTFPDVVYAGLILNIDETDEEPEHHLRDEAEAHKKAWDTRGRHEPDAEPTASPVAGLTPTKDRAWTGEQTPKSAHVPTKLETGITLGETIAMSYLKQLGFADARTLNVHGNNFPVDLIQDHEIYEVKAGLSSNGPSAQQWRATEGEPTEKEKAWLRTASPEAKARWHLRKQQAIMARKQRAVAIVSKETGHTVTLKTIAMIINHDQCTADLYRFDGAHLRIGWSSDQAKQGYVGSYKYC